MKYLILQGDGMADRPQEKLDGATPLQYASTPNMDNFASSGTYGVAETIPPDLPVGSSVGNMSLMGLDPKEYFTGRAALEAKSQGIELDPTDLVFRCNLVKLHDYGHKRLMEDYSGGHISSTQVREVISVLNRELADSSFLFESGVSYRNLLLWKEGLESVSPKRISLTPPHDISGKPVEKYLPSGPDSEKLREKVLRSASIMSRLPTVNKTNSIWLWGMGTKPSIPTIQDEYNLRGNVISAVDLVNGLGVYRGLDPLNVPGVTGTIDTNFEGKVQAALSHLEEGRLVFLHVEAPDEASHGGDLSQKVRAIELFDRKIVGPVRRFCQESTRIAVLLATDHYTCLQSRAHERGLIPYVLFRSERGDRHSGKQFTEPRDTQVNSEALPGHHVFKRMIGGGG